MKDFEMATNLAIDDRLIEEVRKSGKHKTKKEAVTAAMLEYIRCDAGIHPAAPSVENSG